MIVISKEGRKSSLLSFSNLFFPTHPKRLFTIIGFDILSFMGDRKYYWEDQDFGEGDTFTQVLGEKYFSLKSSIKLYGQGSTEVQNEVINIAAWVKVFWAAMHQRQIPTGGSFGLDSQGNEQEASCLQILTSQEHSICKWGIREEKDGGKVPVIEVFAVDQKDGITYNVELMPHKLNFEVDRWGGPNQFRDKITILLNQENQFEPRLIES